MARNIQGINILHLLLVVFATFPLTRTTNIDCSGRPFHCVNSTHFMICVDIGRGLSSTVDDFVIPCPLSTECRKNNRFECEYPPPSSTTTTVPTTMKVIDVATEQQKETTSLWGSKKADYQTYTSLPVVTTTDQHFYDETTVVETAGTNIIHEPSTAAQTLENVTEQDVNYTVNKNGIEQTLKFPTTVFDNYIDVVTTVYSESGVFTPDITTTDTVTQLNETTTFLYSPKESSTDFTTENIVDAFQDFSSTNTDQTTDIDKGSNNLSFTINGKFNATTEEVTDIYTSTTSKPTNIIEIAANDTENNKYTTKDTTTIESTILMSENAFGAHNIDATTVFRTTIFDVRDDSSKSPKSVSPTDFTVVNRLDSSTLLANDFNGEFTTEAMTIQNIDLPLTPYVSPETTESGSRTYNTRNQDSVYNEAAQDKPIITKKDSEANLLVTESVPLDPSSTQRGTTIIDVLTTTLGSYDTERGNSDIYDLNLEYSERHITSNDRFKQTTDYTTQSSGDLITTDKENTHTFNTFLTAQDLQLTVKLVDESTPYIIDSSDNNIKTTIDPVRAGTIYIEDSTKPDNILGPMKAKIEIPDINFKENYQDVTTSYIMPPTVEKEVETVTYLFDQTTGTPIMTSSNMDYTMTTSIIPETTTQEASKETITENLNSEIGITEDTKSTPVTVTVEIVNFTKSSTSSSLSENRGISNLVNNEIINATIHATESVTTDINETDGKNNMHDQILINNSATEVPTELITETSIISNYSKYSTTSLLNDKSLYHEMATTTTQTNVIDTNCTKFVQPSTQDMAFDPENGFVSTTAVSNTEVQIDPAELITILINTYETTVDYDFNSGHTETYTHDDITTPQLQSTISDYTKYDMPPSTNYESITSTTTYIDADINTVTEPLRHEVLMTTQSNMYQNDDIRSTEYISTSKLQTAPDMIYELDNIPIFTAGDVDVQIEHEADITVPITTAVNIKDFGVNLGYNENNMFTELYPSESTTLQNANVDKKTSPPYIFSTTDQPNRDAVIVTSESVESKKGAMMETTTPSLTDSSDNVQSIGFFTTTITTVEYTNFESVTSKDFITSTTQSEMEKTNTEFSFDRSNNVQMYDNTSDSPKYKMVGFTPSNARINNANIFNEDNNNNSNSMNPTGNTLKENPTKVEYSTLGTNTEMTQDGNNYSTYNVTDGIQSGVESSKNVSTNTDTKSQKNHMKIEPNEKQYDSMHIYQKENKDSPGNIYDDKADSNVTYNKIFNTITILAAPGDVLRTTTYKPVKTNTQVITESQHQDPIPDIRNITYKVNAGDHYISQKNNTSSLTNETNKLAKFALSNRPAQRSNEVRRNVANNSYLHSDQVIKPNFHCLYRYRGRYADNENCRKFYICIGKPYPIIGICPIDTVFSEFRKQCTKNLSHCVRNYEFHCTSPGRFGDIFNNSIYYICVKSTENKFLRYKLQCDNGYHLNKDTIQCVPDVLETQSMSESIDSQGSTDTSVSATNSSESRKINSKGDYFICENEGKFPDPSHCRKYYVCSKNKQTFKRKLKSCDSDEVFDKGKRKCVDADSAEC